MDTIGTNICASCDLCGVYGNLLLCSGCRGSWYCSKEHQKTHWSIHRDTCRSRSISKSNYTDKNNQLPQYCYQQNPQQYIQNVHPVMDNQTSIQNNQYNPMIASQSYIQNSVPVNNKYQREYDFPSPSYVPLNTNMPQSPMVSPLMSPIPSPAATLSPYSAPLTPVSPCTAQTTYSSYQGTPSSHHQTTTTSTTTPLTTQTSQASQVVPSIRESDDKLVDYIVTCLMDYGICVVDRFIGEERGDLLIDDIEKLENTDTFKMGQIINFSEDNSEQIRGDKILWVEKGDKNCAEVSRLINRLDALMIQCNGRLGQYKLSGRTKAMIAKYPGNGSGYKRHVDNPNEDGRCITIIYYLNKDWDIKKDGGLLRIFPTCVDKVADIEPIFDRLIFFWSDARNPHEVQPTFKPRYALTLWYFNAEERLKAKQRYQKNS